MGKFQFNWFSNQIGKITIKQYDYGFMVIVMIIEKNGEPENQNIFKLRNLHIEKF